jgi:hypothetical protein
MLSIELLDSKNHNRSQTTIAKDFDRVQCQLLQLNEVSYVLDEFDRVLPDLDVDRWCQQSISDLTESGGVGYREARGHG